METIIKELKDKLNTKLTYNYMQNMQALNFRIFITDLFTKLSYYKDMGVTKNDLFEFINDLFYEAGDKFEHDLLFEQRSGIISEEIMDRGTLPSFWNTNLDIYLHKWTKYFEYEEKGD